MKATLTDGTVLDGTKEEIAAVLRELHEALPTSDQGKTSANGNGSPPATIWTEGRVKAVWNWLYGDQKELVKFMLDHEGRATLEQLIKHLQAEKGNVIAGLLSCITRN